MLLKMIQLSYAREDYSWLAETMWAKLRPYIDDDLQKMWRMKAREQSYNAMIWKLRVIMLTLHEIGVLPESRIEPDKRVFGEYDAIFENPKHEDLFPSQRMSIAGKLEYSDLMMHYYFLTDDLVGEGYDLESMIFMADVGWALCSPYITWEDMEEWQEKNTLSQQFRWEWFKSKISLISSILDREGIQFKRRAIDYVSQDVKTYEAPHKIEESSEDAFRIDDDTNLEEV